MPHLEDAGRMPTLVVEDGLAGLCEEDIRKQFP